MIEARRSDLPVMVDTLTEAFADDPSMCWIWPDRAERLARYPHSFRALVRGASAFGLALCSPDGAAASLWRLPGRIHPGRRESWRNRGDMRRAFVSGGERAGLLGAQLHERMPDGDYWYLQLVGVRAAAQGRGVGKAVISAGLDRARAAGMPVYVETTNPANLPLYLRLGFSPEEDWQVTPGGPHVWTMMWRG